MTPRRTGTVAMLVPMALGAGIVGATALTAVGGAYEGDLDGPLLLALAGTSLFGAGLVAGPEAGWIRAGRPLPGLLGVAGRAGVLVLAVNSASRSRQAAAAGLVVGALALTTGEAVFELHRLPDTPRTGPGLGIGPALDRRGGPAVAVTLRF